VFENRVLRRIFLPKRDEVTGGWRKLYNEELHNLYFSPTIIRVIKSSTMKWRTDIWLESLKGKYHLQNLGVDGRIILSWIIRKGVDWIYLAQDRDWWRAVVNTVMNLWTP
jgi:hypothetical protein